MSHRPHPNIGRARHQVDRHAAGVPPKAEPPRLVPRLCVPATALPPATRPASATAARLPASFRPHPVSREEVAA